VLYSLVALGFVLIFKASGVFNFAQGAMVLTAALALVRSLELLTQWGWPFWLALVGAFLFAAAIMAAVAWLAEKLVLRKLVNQEGMFDGGILVNELDIWPAVIAGLLVAGLAIFFQRTRIGRALRAVADDHAAAQSVGIPLNQIWFIVWLVAGLVALVAGAVWGSKLGVQFSLTLLALKALPVLILGGFTSVPGAIVGGLIIGAGEKLAEVFLGPSMGGGIEIWFAYVVALLFLLLRPQGLFGERIIERV
jgi:branched-chain amino acid transport system permease protein